MFRTPLATLAIAFALAALSWAPGKAQEGDPTTATADNFIRAETDLYFGAVVREGGLGTFEHHRDVTDIAHQNVIRLNRDTVYSAALLDLDAGPATITLPDPGDRFMSLLLINEDHYVRGVYYGGGSHILTKDDAGTRYLMAAVRTLADPNDPADLEAVHALQDAMTIEQAGAGSFEIPNWDAESQKIVRDALLALAAPLRDTRGMFGSKDQVDPVRHLIGSASAWGGNPETEALYLNVTPEQNDGETLYRLNVDEVPVDGFWSVSLYNAEGYYEENEYGAYSLNNITATKGADGSVAIQFGGCDGQISNCLPIMPGWNYMVRLYRPRGEILNGGWTFPEAEPVT